MALSFAPTNCSFDPIALGTHGQFKRFRSQNPCLLLGTHGEFPRGLAVQAGVGAQDGVGTGRRRRRIEPEVIIPCKDEDIIALTLLMADDDDWW